MSKEQSEFYKQSETIFVPVLGFEDRYHVSQYGDIKALDFEKKAINGMRVYKAEKMLKRRIDKDGYVIYTLYKDGKRIDKKAHRIVLASFTGEWKNTTVNHKDGDKENNNIENLEWMTITENNRHALKTGLRKPKFGCESPRGLLKETVLNIKNLLSIGLSQNAVAVQAGVSQSSVNRIKNKLTYTD